MEEWVDIEGYEGLYQVSNLGRVKHLKQSHKNRFGECEKGRTLCWIYRL